jgi:hypothetical protein
MEIDVGWRAWDAYEREAHERWKAMPWRDRFSPRYMTGLIVLAILAIVLYASLR